MSQHDLFRILDPEPTPEPKRSGTHRYTLWLDEPHTRQHGMPVRDEWIWADSMTGAEAQVRSLFPEYKVTFRSCGHATPDIRVVVLSGEEAGTLTFTGLARAQ